jgi:hypothetical protein
MNRCFRRYRGVAIHRSREMVAGSDFDFDFNGIMIDRKPEFDIFFALADGTFRSDTLAEIKLDIDNCFAACCDTACMTEVLNHDED